MKIWIQLFNGLLVVIPIIMLFFAIYNKRNQVITVKQDGISKAWERCLAYLIDFLICILFLCIVYILLKKVDICLSAIWWQAIYVVFTILYFALFEGSYLQASMGKMFEGIVVTDICGNKITFSRSIIRYLLIIFGNAAFLIGLLFIVFGKNKQGFHDILTNTLVIKKEARRREGTPMTEAGRL